MTDCLPDSPASCLRQRAWLLDYSRLPLSKQVARELSDLPKRFALKHAVERLFSGQAVNRSEHQPALHMALRAADPARFLAAEAAAELSGRREDFLALATDWHGGEARLSDIIHIGIGGSDLGPRLISDALDEDDSAVRVHWLSTLDARRLRRLLARLDRAKTGVVVASKSFATEETLLQAGALRDWLGSGWRKRMWAVTARPDRAAEFGLAETAIHRFPGWTGGRFSLWSSVGVSAAAVIGVDRFRRLLEGAAQADLDFEQSPASASLATMIAICIHALRRELDYSTLGVIAYEPRLRLLSDYLQQLLMESLGKRVDNQHQRVGQATVPLVFGGVGTDLQHSIFQALHQGSEAHPLLLVGALEDPASQPDWHRRQVAHLLAQAAALKDGRKTGERFRHMPGKRPTLLLLTQRLDAHALGYLLASFEHAVYALAVFWGINPFDQWGVEEGKRLAERFHAKLLERDPVRLDEFPQTGYL